jgi:hypothetical protein
VFKGVNTATSILDEFLKQAAPSALLFPQLAVCFTILSLLVLMIFFEVLRKGALKF